ncbi:MAG: OmpA family protein [Saprospiraceae bacterium]|nr:OmpA family protein [Saprospiraceae bacterium]
MMYRIAFLLLWLPVFAPAQNKNLVLNPGFEELKGPHQSVTPCRFMKYGKDFNNVAKNWTSVSDRTPDLIHYDTTAGPCIYPPPHSGNRYVGLITFLPRQDCGYTDDYHEFIEGKLAQPLVPGMRYKVSFWINQSDSVSKAHLRSVYGDKVVVYPVAANNIGIALQSAPLNVSAGFSEQKEWINMEPAFETKTVLRANNEQWRQVQGWFTATEASKYFIIGNFRNDVQTSIESRYDLSKLPPLSEDAKKNAFQRMMRIAYYCIDDVSILEDPNGSAVQEAMEREGKYTFQGVLFATGSHQLAEASLEELGALAAWLTEHPEKQAEIAGHTDNVGSDESNRLLSERRARSVFEYLTQQGIDAERLSYKGYGKTRPVATNASEEGRRQNRRVECVLK